MHPLPLQELRLQHREALIGFGGLPLAGLPEPGISVIARDHAAIGREAAGLPFDRLDGGRGRARHGVLPTRYLARVSGDIPRRRGPLATASGTCPGADGVSESWKFSVNELIPMC